MCIVNKKMTTYNMHAFDDENEFYDADESSNYYYWIIAGVASATIIALLMIFIRLKVRKKQGA